MTHEYSVQIHNWISQKMEEMKKQKMSAEKIKDKETEEYLIGQIDELLFFQQYLSDQIDLKTQTYYK